MALLLPGQPGFAETLLIPPPSPGMSCDWVMRKGEMLMEAVTGDQLDEYFDSGEYDERLEEIEPEQPQTSEIPINEGLRSTVLYLPCSVAL